MGRRLGQHRPGGVDPEHVGGARHVGQQVGQLARPASEIDRPPAWYRLDQREEVPKGGAALVLEAVVLVGVPCIGHAVCIQVQYK